MPLLSYDAVITTFSRAMRIVKFLSKSKFKKHDFVFDMGPVDKAEVDRLLEIKKFTGHGRLVLTDKPNEQLFLLSIFRDTEATPVAPKKRSNRAT